MKVANEVEEPNGRADWVEVRLRMPPDWRDWFSQSATIHACSLADEIRYVLGHWKNKADTEKGA